SIGTDGLMGNKLININSASAPGEPIEVNDILMSRKPVETDEMLRTLSTTNNNMERITNNLYEISVKLNSSKSLWTLLSDTTVTQDLRSAVVSFKKAGANTAEVTAHANKIVTGLENGNGPVYKLFSDTTLSNQLTYSVQQIQVASRETSSMMKDLKRVVDGMKQGDGTAGLILSDTSLRQSLFNSARNLEQGTQRLNENMEAMRSHVLFRGYFKKLEKQEKKDNKSGN
ncbi:MAG TPA: MCE family protein, partial [Cyclobacteriaceae bacterium]|nr:MCE family protein [Cyclobacteriaceae bacterium]